MTGDELIQYVETEIGTEATTGILRPYIYVEGVAALPQFVRLLVDSDSELLNRFKKSVVNQTYSSSQFAVPSDFLEYKQIKFTRLDIGGTLYYQIKDRQKLKLMSSGAVQNVYYALEGGFLYFGANGSASGSTLNMTYVFSPALSDITAEAIPLFVDFLVQKLALRFPRIKGGK